MGKSFQQQFKTKSTEILNKKYSVIKTYTPRIPITNIVNAVHLEVFSLK